MAANPGDRSLKETPTWVVALVCLVMVALSMLLEHGIHKLRHWFHKCNKKAMNEALEKIKSDPSRFRFAHQTSFVKRHLGMSARLNIEKLRPAPGP